MTAKEPACSRSGWNGADFLWPSAVDGAVTISSAQLGYLLSGIDWRNPQETWRPTSVG